MVMKRILTFGLLLLAASLVHAQGILLKSGTIDTSRPMPEVEALDEGDQIVLVQFPGPVTAEQEKALREASLRVYAYLPENAFLVKMPAGARRQARAFGASWTGSYRPSYKMSPQVSTTTGDGSPAGERRIVMLQVFPDADVRELARRIRDDLGLGVVGSGQGALFSRIRLLMTPGEIAERREDLARLGEVFWIDVEPRRTLLNDTTIWVGQSGLDGDHGGGATPVFEQGIYGEGQIAAIVDTGLDADMCWFQDPARGLPPTNACNGGTAVDPDHRKVLAVDFLASGDCADGLANNEWDNHGHGTHVAGTIAGDDLAHPLDHDPADGMAPGARLVIQDAGFKIDDCGDLPGIGCPVVDLKPIFQQAYDQGARLHSNSWGDNENGRVQNNYSSGSQDVDEFMWKHKDFLIFFAAGNDGTYGLDTVGSPSTAKNGVSVGATQRAMEADQIASFSSCGPTADGRIKPDITVPGVEILSAANDSNIASNNCGFRASSGTSMATPGAVGLAALVRQYYADGWYPGGGKGSGRLLKPSAALVKATLINSSAPMTGSRFPVRTQCQGWGRVLLGNALYFAGQDRKLWMLDDSKGFRTGQKKSQTFKFKIGSGGGPLKITLVWTDYPSNPAAGRNLVNDLDLTVSGPGGDLLLGNVFDNGQSKTGGSPDRLNTVEQVQLESPEPGIYTVMVRPVNVPRGKQPFALVVTGDVASASRR